MRFNVRTRLAAYVLLIGAMPATSSAVITLDADFDHGGLDEANSSVVGNTVLLAGRDNFNSGDWKWIHFKASGVNGQTPLFDIDNDFATGSSRLDDHEMVYSYDQENWFFFDNNEHLPGFGRYNFSNNSAFTQDDVYVAYGLPYSYQKVVDHVNQIKASPWVSPTSSSDANLVVAQSPGGTDDLGRIIQPKDLYGFKVTDSSSVGPKTKIALLSGVHANEVLGNHTLEGLIDFIISDDPRAAELRKQAEFYVYPMVNPDGRFAGYNRSTVQHDDRDPNRFWTEAKYADMGDIMAIGEALKADTGSDLDYFIDVHSSTNTDNHFIYTNNALDPFWTSFQALEPAVQTNGTSLVNDTSIKFANNQLNAEFVGTFETEFIPGENIDRFNNLGKNLGIAFQTVLAPLPPTGLVQDFLFDDANGTLLPAAANTGSPGNQWTGDADLSNTSVQSGGLLIQKNNDNFASHYLQIDDIAEGEAWLVMEIDGWNFVDFDPGQREELRLGFLDNDTLTGSSITAQVEIERNAAGGIEINGQALGGGGTSIATGSLSTTQNDAFTVVLHLDKNTNSYEIMTRNGAGAWTSLGSGQVDPARDGNSLRLVVNNDFGGTGEFFDIGRIYLTHDNPLTVALIGDLDGDGFVGINDLNIVLSNWNQSVPPGDPLADPSGDGFVGIDDLNTVLSNWNDGTPPGSQAVIPEPTSLAVLGVSSFGLLRRVTG